jgi:hypothetical protein
MWLILKKSGRKNKRKILQVTEEGEADTKNFHRTLSQALSPGFKRIGVLTSRA